MASCSETEPAVPTTVAVVAIDTMRSIAATASFTAAVQDQRGRPMSSIAVDSWQTSDAGVVTITNAGLATAIANGSATVAAQVGSLSGSTVVVVRQKVSAVGVTGANAIGSLGSTVQLAATPTDAGGSPITGRPVTWSSVTPTIATIDPASGLATAVAPGNATLRATVDGVNGDFVVSIVQVPHSVTITAPDTLRSLGETAQFTAIVRDSGGAPVTTPNLRWASNNAGAISVDSVGGLATAVANGAAFLRALANPVLDSTRVVVRQRVDASKSTVAVARSVLFATDSVRATITARDALGTQLAFGGTSVAVSLVAGSGSPSVLTQRSSVDQGDGSYVVDLIGTGVGSALAVNATLDGVLTSAGPSLRVVGFTKLAVQSSFGGRSCGIITTGDLYCWGNQFASVRGRGPNATPVADTTPTLVSGGHQWTDVAIATLSACALTDEAKLYCWGSPSNGGLANGMTTGVEVPTPTIVSPDSSYISVTAASGAVGICGITVAHNLSCWGYGTWGRLGNGTNTDSPIPVAVSGGHKFVSVGTSFSGSCGITEAGEARCWGFYTVLGIGSGPFPDSCDGVDCAKTPVAVDGGHTFRPVMLHDGNKACSITTSDQTYCWGTQLDEVTGAPAFTTLATGDMDYCGLAQNGTAYCWGSNRNGRFGLPANSNQTISTPVAVPGGQVFTSLSMTQNHMCGITTDGNAFCWGANDSGELGNRTTTPSTTPVRVRLF